MLNAAQRWISTAGDDTAADETSSITNVKLHTTFTAGSCSWIPSLCFRPSHLRLLTQTLLSSFLSWIFSPIHPFSSRLWAHPFFCLIPASFVWGHFDPLRPISAIFSSARNFFSNCSSSLFYFIACCSIVTPPFPSCHRSCFFRVMCRVKLRSIKLFLPFVLVSNTDINSLSVLISRWQNDS